MGGAADVKNSDEGWKPSSRLTVLDEQNGGSVFIRHIESVSLVRTSHVLEEFGDALVMTCNPPCHRTECSSSWKRMSSVRSIIFFSPSYREVDDCLLALA